MRTRVVRYWSGTDWLHRVEKFDQSAADDYIYDPGGGKPMEHIPKGTWRWSFVLGEASRDHAMDVAQRIALKEPAPEVDVVAEFGQ